MTDNPHILTTPFSDPATLEAHFHIVQLNDEFSAPLGFQCALPRTWRRQILDRSAPTASRPLVRMARFFDPAGSGETVISCAFLPREVHPADWLRIYIANARYRIIDWRERPSRFGEVGDALVCGEDETSNMWHRLTPIKDGNLLFLIDSRMASPDPLVQEVAYMAVAHFRLIAPTGQPYAESFRETELTAERPVCFLIPELWYEQAAGAAPPEGGAIQYFEHRDNGQLLSSLVAVAGSEGRITATEIETVTLQKCEANGIDISAEPELLYHYSSPDGASQVLAKNWRAESTGQPLTVLSAQVSLHGVPVALTLLSPTAEEQMELWAIHRRAFDIAVESLRPGRE